MAEKDPRVIGARIARARQARDLTQAQLAGHLGVAESTVANWERGVSYPKRKLGKIEQFFGERLDYDEPDGTRQPQASSSATQALNRAQAELDELRRLLHDRDMGKAPDENGGRRAS